MLIDGKSDHLVVDPDLMDVVADRVDVLELAFTRDTEDRPQVAGLAGRHVVSAHQRLADVNEYLRLAGRQGSVRDARRRERVIFSGPKLSVWSTSRFASAPFLESK